MTKSRFLVLLAVLGFFVLSAAPSRADDVYNVVVQKQDTKKQTGWNLSDWLATRDKMRLMDLWLALHSPSPYEFFLDGNYTLPNQGRTAAWGGKAAAYASIFGLQGEDEFSANLRSSRTGIFDLRIFGLYVQSTNITLQAGVRGLTDAGQDYRDAMAGVEMSVYITRYLGVEGAYRRYFDTTPSASGITISENYYMGGLFLDFSLLRLYGEYWSQPATYTSPGAVSTVSRTGVTLGARIFL
jgi:hypothetical protein